MGFLDKVKNTASNAITSTGITQEERDAMKAERDAAKAEEKAAKAAEAERKRQIEEQRQIDKNTGKLIEVYVHYLGGGQKDIAVDKDGDVMLSANADGISINRSVMIPYSQITGIKQETQEQIEKRITATRILLVGVFALAFKKKNKTVEKYLTIDFTDDTGIESTMVFSGIACAHAHTKIYEFFHEYKINHPDEDAADTAPAKSPAEQIKEFKELLDIGAITQEEFDAKKKQLLEI